MIVSVYGIGTVDGLNEKGLAAHALYLKSTELPARDPAKPALQIALWAQYLLDNAATVDEAIALMDDIQLVMVEAHGHQATIHLAVEDAGGDSAIMENIGGELIVHPVDRFQRAAYFSAMLPEPRDERAAAAGLLSVMRNVSVPFGAPYGDFGIYNTEYRTVIDLAS
ncbi:MAG TPA: linear amide C-N hydrolase, partial [Trebonia sp.]|nr:linear amide C-N hydrolase [Trebonia sp.]